MTIKIIIMIIIIMMMMMVITTTMIMMMIITCWSTVLIINNALHFNIIIFLGPVDDIQTSNTSDPDGIRPRHDVDSKHRCVDYSYFPVQVLPCSCIVSDYPFLISRLIIIITSNSSIRDYFT